jgi:hypothetical protein
MGRRAKPEYQVKKARNPNSGKVWFILGRPNVKTIRAWFNTKESAEAEANERNNEIRRLGENVVASARVRTASSNLKTIETKR